MVRTDRRQHLPGGLLVQPGAGLDTGVTECLVEREHEVAGADTGVADEPEDQPELRVILVQAFGELEGVLHRHDVLGDRDGWLAYNR